MATTKPKQTNGVATESELQTPESLDKVRDILFGGQMRTVETRFRSLEERLQQEQKAQRNDLTRRIAEVEEAAKKELAILAERLSSERAKRLDDVKALATEFKDALKSLERRHQKLEESASLSDADLRDQLMKSSAALSAEFSRTADRLSAALEGAVASLRADKVDTTTLTHTLTEMAARLAKPGRTTGKGNARA